MSLQTWRQYGGKQNLPSMNNITAHTLVVDKVTIRENYNGLFSVNGELDVSQDLKVSGNTILNKNAEVDGDLTVKGNMEIDKNTQFLGDIVIYGNAIATQNMTINGIAAFNGNMNINGTLQLDHDLTTVGNVVVGTDLVFDGTGKYMVANTMGVGVNTGNPHYGLDIVTDNSGGFSIYSSQPTNRNILAQNGQHYGILATTSDISSSFQFFNDTSLNIGNPGAKMQYNRGGELTVDTSNITLFSGLTVSKDKTKQGHLLNETLTIYDVSDGYFMYECFQDTTLKKGQSATLMTTDNNSLTFMNMKTPVKDGISIGGGIYPIDRARSMGVMGWTDFSTKFVPSWNFVSGNAAVINRSTIGINTVTNRTDNFVLDINGPVHLTHEQISKTFLGGFEIKQVLFGDTSGRGIAIGSPSTDISSNYRQDILFTDDGGQKWSINRNLGTYASDVETNLHFLTGTACQNFTFVSAYDPSNNEQAGFLFYSIDNGNKWSEINNYIKNISSLSSQVNVIGLASVFLSSTNRIRVFVIYKTSTNGVVLTYFDVPTSDQNVLSEKTNLPVLRFGSSGSHTYSVYDQPVPTDAFGNPLYTYVLNNDMVHDAKAYDISGNTHGTTMSDLKFIKTSKQGYVYVVGSINSNTGSKILWVDSGLEQPTDNTRYIDISSFVVSDLAVGNNNNAVVVGKNNTNTGVIYYTNSGTTSSVWTQSNIYGVSGSIPVINGVYALDELHGMAVGNSGLILYSKNGFVDWYVVSQDWLRCFGNPVLLKYVSWSGVSMPNSSTFILTAINRSYNPFGQVRTRIGSSDQYIFYWPNLFGLLNNDLLDISGNIRMDGYLRIGNISDNSIQTTGGINIGGNVVIQGSTDIINDLNVYGNLVLTHPVVLTGELSATKLVLTGEKIDIGIAPISGVVGTGAIAIGDNAGKISQGGFAIAVGSNSGQGNQGGSAIAIGYLSGQSNQGADAIAIGYSSGNTQQGTNTVALGTHSGEKNQGNESISIGLYSGFTGQGISSIALGKYAGQQNQGIQSLAIGTNAGNASQGDGSLAIGINAGYVQQGVQTIAIGNHSGENQQGNYSVAFGVTSGQNQQGVYSVAVGYGSGQNQQNDRSVALGYYAGSNQQSGNSVAIGETAGKIQQGGNSVAIGTQAGLNLQMDYSIAIGFNAGQLQQNLSSICLGRNAGTNKQGGNAVAIGSQSGSISQGGNAVAIGNSAGYYSQGSKSISIGFQSGQTAQSDNSVAIGQNAGQTQQQNYSVAVGYYAAAMQQGQKSVAIGHYSGNTAQGQYAIAVGPNAGQTQQGDNSISLGNQAGQTQQGIQSVSIGYLTGQGTQGIYSVAIGTKAGQTKQGSSAVAIGQNAGAFTQGGNAVAIGYYAGNVSQGVCSIAIGNGAGSFSQGEYSIAIGYQVAQTNQTRNTVAIGKNITVSSENAAVINTSTSSIIGDQPGFFVKPIRASKDTNLLYYNSGTGEIRYADLSAYDVGVLGANLGISTTTITASGRITASLGITSTTDISSNGGIKTTTLDAFGRITTINGITTGLDISANGGIKTTTLDAYGRITTINGITSTSDISANGGLKTTTLAAYGRITATGGLTATSDISANGGITTTTLFINPTLKGSETDILYYDSSSRQVKYGAAPSSVNLNPYASSDVRVTGGNMFVQNNTTTIYTGAQNVAASTYVKLFTDGTVSATGGITSGAVITGTSFNAVSDRRLKKEIAPLGTTLNKINQLNPVEYKWKKTGCIDYGFIAQEYYRVFPDLTPKGFEGEEPLDENDNPKYYTLDYGKITCFLTKAIQELAQQREQTGIHGRSSIPENQQEVVIALNQWNAQTVYIVQLTPINGNRVLSSSPVIEGRFTVYGETGSFFWSVFPETSSSSTV